MSNLTSSYADSAPSPIADLSYRNYDGPLSSPQFRWWVIARQALLASMKKRSLWIYTFISAAYYLIMIVVLFFVDRISATSPNGGQMQQSFLGRLVWKDQFLHGFSYAQLLLLIIALLIGAGSIANDNRANALLVYLSKPCTKLDYVVGKWMAVFLVMLGVMALPSVVFYAYGALSFREYGFLKDDPWLLLRVLAIMPLAAALHTSLVLVISSIFKQGRIAGATYAGIYFVGYFFTVFMKIPWAINQGNEPAILKWLSYASIDGLQIGLAKAILRTDGTPPFGVPPPRSFPALPAPPLIPIVGIVLAVTALSIYVMWTRVRAVEVVG